METVQKFARALLELNAQQVVTVLVLVFPVGAAVWCVLRWAYEARLQTATEALRELRTDFDRKVEVADQRARESTQLELQQAIAELRTLRSSEDSRRDTLADLYDAIGPDRTGPALNELLEHVYENYSKPKRLAKRRKDAIRRGIPWIDPAAKPPTTEV